MSGPQRDRPLVEIEAVEVEPTSSQTEVHMPDSPLVAVETLDTTEPIRPQPDEPKGASQASEDTARRSGGWIAWSIIFGVLALGLVGTVDWVLNLLVRVPILGVPGALAAVALITGLVGLVWRETHALRRLRDVKNIQAEWEKAEGEELRRLILRLGTDLGETAGARRAADLVDNSGPDAARKRMSKVMEPRDDCAVDAVASAARQGFVMVTASPSPALDALLLIARALRLLRQIAVIYGYRPGALALRALALAAGRDAGAVALADVLAQAAAEGASRSMAKVGDAATAAGATATATGAGVFVGIPLAAAGLGLSLLGRTVGATGGALGGGAAAAWRLYRFGLMVLVATRPLPFDQAELADVKARARAEVLSLTRGQSEDRAKG